MGCFEIKLRNEYYRKVKEINKKMIYIEVFY